MEREILANLLWEKAEPTLFISKEEFLRALDGWNIQPVHIDDELSWITVQRGPEFHFQSVGQTKPMPRRMIREFLDHIIAEHGYALTKTPKDDERQHRFNRAFGFKAVGEDEFDTHFMIKEI